MIDGFPPVRHPALAPFAALAEEYCALIEDHAGVDAPELLTRAHPLLARLYATALELPLLRRSHAAPDESDDDAADDTAEIVPARSLSDYTPQPDELTDDEWQAIFRGLTAELGEGDFYRQVFNPYESPEQPEILRSLADDLTDVYRDLLDGLVRWRRSESGNALRAWRSTFDFHWGRHASAALYAIYSLSAEETLDWPPVVPAVPAEGEAHLEP